MSKRSCSSQANVSDLEIEIKRQKSSVSCSSGKEVPAEDKVVLNVLLNCEQTKSSETKQVHFKSLPTTPLEIKKKIEEDFSIPSCVQTLHYQSMILKDSDQLQHTHFRSGDMFVVDYPIEAECEMTKNVIKWLKELLDLLRSIEEGVLSPDEENDLVMSTVENLIYEGEKDDITKALYHAMFNPWKDKKKQVNRFYFQQEGGLDVLMKVYGILVSKEWGDLGIDREFHIYLEDMCASAVCMSARSLPYKHQVVQLGGLEMSMKTLFRRQLLGGVDVLDTRVYYTLYSALVALCK